MIDFVCIAEPNDDDIGPVRQYHTYYQTHACDPIAVFMHNDVDIHAPWTDRVLAEFNDPKVGIVGFGGAVGIGTSEIYKRPYDVWQLQRIGYRSNQRDWHIHGTHETGACNVAVVDGFFIAARKEFLFQIKGWSWFPFQFHCYDTAVCLMAARHGWKVRMVGVDCTHRGGGTSITPEYKARCEKAGTTIEREHSEPHKWLYSEFKDCLPLRVA